MAFLIVAFRFSTLHFVSVLVSIHRFLIEYIIYGVFSVSGWTCVRSLILWHHIINNVVAQLRRCATIIKSMSSIIYWSTLITTPWDPTMHTQFFVKHALYRHKTTGESKVVFHYWIEVDFIQYKIRLYTFSPYCFWHSVISIVNPINCQNGLLWL